MTTNKQKILITGSNGFIGSRLHNFLSSEYDVIGIDRDTTETEYLNNLSCDEKTTQFLEEISPEIIVHTAAEKDLLKCENNRDQAWANNVELTKYLFEFCQKRNIHFIFISSDQVFDGKRGDYKENDYKAPINWYGATKAAAEEFLYNKEKVTVCRIALAFGKIFQKQLSSLSDSLKENKITNQSLLPYFVIAGLKLKREIYLPDDVIATPTSLSFLEWAIKKIIEEKLYGTLHVACQQTVSRFDFAKLIAKKAGLLDNLLMKGLDATASIRPKNVSLNCQWSYQKLNAPQEIASIEYGIERFIAEGGIKQVEDIINQDYGLNTKNFD